MAILEHETNNYYKIEFNDCMIKGRDVIVNFSVYKSPQDREKEKARQPFITEFVSRLQQEATSLYSEIFTGIGALGRSPTDILSETEDNKIDRERFPELRAIQDKMNGMEDIMRSFFERCYKYGDRETELMEYIIPKQELEDYGFNEIWITDPVYLTNKAEIYCGEYEGEEITHEFYYNRLKTVMNENIEDC